MIIPTTKKLLKKIKAGKESQAIIPVARDERLGAGDQVTFHEAVFDQQDTLSLVSDGDAYSVTLTTAQETDLPYKNSILFAIKWDSKAALAALARLKEATSGILLQATAVLGEKTKEGDLIIAVVPAWQEIIKLINKDPKIIFQIDPRKLEELIAASYEKAGYDRVILTPRSGDFGRDVIAEKHGFGCVRILEQVKAYSEQRLVTANDVRAMIGVLATDQKATKGIVTTTSDFAPKIKDDPSIAPHMPFRLELINGDQLLGRLSHLSP
jgi:restriction system protein